MNKISIIIPIYNSENYISKCLDSILQQTYQNFEVLLIDDGSKDSSLLIIKEYCDKYSDKIFAYTQENHGIAYTRNRGISLATGEYIIFVDNDDFLDSNYLDTFYNEIEKGYDIVLGGYRRVDNDNNVLLECCLNDDDIWNKYKIITPWARMYRTKFIKDNNLHFLEANIGEDIFINIVAYSLTSKIKIINYVGYNWFYNKKSVSNTLYKGSMKKLEFEFLINSLFNELIKRNISINDEIEYFFMKQIAWYCMYTCKTNTIRENKKNLIYYRKWIQNNFPNYKKNTYLFFSKPASETLTSRICTTLFFKFNLGQLILFFYNKLWIIFIVILDFVILLCGAQKFIWIDDTIEQLTN